MTTAEHEVRIAPEGIAGDLVIPDRATGIVLFAHGSGSSRHSPRNRYVAQALNRAGFGTLLLDLLTPAEEQVDAASGDLVFDVKLLANRLLYATDWLVREAKARNTPIGYFGASTGAAAALLASTRRPTQVRAVVSRGGRPDLAGEALRNVAAPTLLIVGSRDPQVLKLNQQAISQLGAEKALHIVPRATHLFEEPGALEQVADLARDWFAAHMS